MAISEYAVETACVQLLRQNKAWPSRRDVLDFLGSGSMGTVQKYMPAVEEKHRALIDAIVGTTYEPELSDPLQSLVTQLHQQLFQEAGESMAAERQALEEVFESRRAEWQQMIDEAKEEAKQANGLLARSQQENALLTQRLSDLQGTVRVLEADGKALTAANERLSTQVTNLSAELSSARRNHEANTETIAQLTATVDNLRSGISERDQRIEQLQGEIDRLSRPRYEPLFKRPHRKPVRR